MEGSKKEKLFAALTGVFGLSVLAVTAYTVVVRGPLRTVLADQLTLRMLAETLLVFLWNLFCLSGVRACRGRRRSGRGGSGIRLGILGVIGGVAAFTWCHRIFLPMVVSGVYMAVLILAGRQVLRLVLRDMKLPAAEEASMALVTGSALWMALVCAVSLTGRGGLMLWRTLAAAMALCAAGSEGWYIYRRKPQSSRSASWLPQNKAQVYLAAFIITMVLIQAGRMNIELDYDSLHYGLRSPYVLDNGKGIYEDLGMINLVYTYSKGLEVLTLPLSGTPTYGFVLAFSLWCTLGILYFTAHMAGRFGGGDSSQGRRSTGMWAAAAIAAIPGIMNMAATAKNDNITLLHQLIIYDFICCALCQGNGRTKQPADAICGSGGRRAYEVSCGDEASGASCVPGPPWLLMAVSTYLLTLVYKPTALVFSTALGGTALLCLAVSRRLSPGGRGGWRLLILPGAAAAGLWYRTWLLTGVPVTSIFAGLFEKAGCKVRYPFSFAHVIGDPSALSAGEKLRRLGTRLWEMLFAPVTEDMAHVMIAWGTGLVTFFMAVWLFRAIRLGREERRSPLNRFDCVLLPVMALGSAASIYTLSQVDGNYFILFYALLVISTLRMGGSGRSGGWRAKGIILVMVPFFALNTVITCATGWAGVPGFTPAGIRHMGYYDHRREISDRRVLEGNLALASMFTPRSRVLAFGEHPGVLDLPCSVQSYYDVTGSGGNVYLVKKLAYFKEFLEYAGTEYFFVEAGYLAGQDRALQIIEDMIAEGSLSDIRYEWGNMAAKVTLEGRPPADREAALAGFRENYSMTANNRE